MPEILIRRHIVRLWRDTVAHISTRHPRLGLVYRGRPQPAGGERRAEQGAQMVWQLVDFEGAELGLVAGDYLVPEQRLLDASGWADEVIQDDLDE